MKKIFCPFIFLCISLTAICANAYISNDDGITVRISQDSICDVRQVRLKVVGEKVIKVSATPEEDFVDGRSLIEIPVKAKTPFTISETDSTVSISTNEIIASVSLSTGAVKFLDKNGNLILAEDPNGKKFVPIEVEGKKSYSLCQTFLSLDDKEGLYGLGQHQSDEFNYKGKNEELFQYNTKVSVPFIVSTNNYGVLWDNYSLTRWGNPEPYKQLGQVFKLYDKDGKEGALTGTYTPLDPAVPSIVQREDSIYFEHLIRGDLSKVVNLPKDFPFWGSKIVYEGEIEPTKDGNYMFNQYYSGYQKIYLNDSLIVPERWRTAWNPNSYKFSINLKGKKSVPIRIEWQPNGGTAYAGLRVYDAIDAQEQNKMKWWSEMGPQIDYFFIYGNNMDEVISGYRTVTGKAPIMPKWVLGYWQSREKYNTQDEIVATLAEFRNREFPIDNIVLDWLHWRQDDWGSHEFDTTRFPNPKEMIDSVHAMNGRFMISVWPKFYSSTEHFKEFDDNGWMYQQAITDSIRDWVGPGYLGSFYDAYSPEARKLFWHQIQDHYYPLGIDAWWMDASEPNIRDCTDIQYRKDLCGPTELGPSTEYFNAYALMNAEAIYNGQRSVDPDKRVFLLTRSGFAGLQRYSTATWSGDIATRWEDMKAQISAGLNFSISGIPWWSMDIGGFCVEDRYVAAEQEYERTKIENDDLKEWRELNARWHQFGAFAPIYRSHGQWPYREPFNIAPTDHPAYKSIAYYNKLRYDLMPYLYSLAAMTHFNDYTIMRPLAMDFTLDNRTYNISDQYMFGPAFLVAPVYSNEARSRNVYLPEGNLWYDFYTGEHYEGGQTINATAPYERMPLFTKAGAIIPFGPDINWSDQKPADEITIYVYAGKNGEFSLYEDENTNYNYEKGMFATINMTYDDKNGIFTIGNREGTFPGMLKERDFTIVKVTKDEPQPYTKEAQGTKVHYTGKEISVKI